MRYQDLCFSLHWKEKDFEEKTSFNEFGCWLFVQEEEVKTSIHPNCCQCTKTGSPAFNTSKCLSIF